MRSTLSPPLRHARTFITRLLLCSTASATLLTAAALHAQIQAPSELEPWYSEVRDANFTAASNIIEEYYQKNPDDVRLATSYASALLGRNPRTRANVRLARSIFTKLAEQLPTTEDNYRPLCLYLLGRIEHTHATPVRLDLARQFYEQLRREHPEHTLAQQAGVQLIILTKLETTTEQDAKLAAMVEELLLTAEGETARRALHDMAKDFYDSEFVQDKESALRHLLASIEISTSTPYEDSDPYIIIAGTARDLGHYALAAKYYQAFADAAPRDTRAYTARRLARQYAEMAAAQGEPPPSLSNENQN